MKKLIFTLFIISELFSVVANAQVAKKIVVEHFTNTNCSVCASRNPGLFTNLNNQKDLLRLAVHPSSPYSSCKLYQQNAASNDARTKYYGFFGGTPRIVINGVAIAAGADYSSNALFDSYKSLTTPASIRIEQKKFGSDSIRAIVVIKTEATHSLGDLSLFVALAEDTVFYKGNNGEAQHYSVFRQSLTAAEGLSVTLPATIGDSVLFSFTAANNSIWNFDRIFSLVILQESANKALVQAEAAMPMKSMPTAGQISNSVDLQVAIYPNPASNSVTIQMADQAITRIELATLDGKILNDVTFLDKEHTLDLSDLSRGTYVLKISNSKGNYYQKLIKD
jgi:hypothetical protein